MNNFLAMLREGLSRVRKFWLIAAVVILGIMVGLATFASGALSSVLAAIPGQQAVASVDYQAPDTATMPPMPGMPGMETPTAMPVMPGMTGMETPDTMPDMPGMVMPTMVPGDAHAPSGGDLDALAQQMQAMMQSLDGMMGQLDQKGSHGVYAPPTATPVTVDMQAIMAEMESINQTMGPLMLRIQADLQGNPSAEELASVRAQVEQINQRIGRLLAQLQAARGGTMAGTGMDMSGMPMPGMAATPTMEPGMGQANHSQDKLAQLDQMLKQMQAMLHEIQSDGAAGHSGAMTGMPAASPAPMTGMGHGPSMDDMMQKMDDMMAKMDSMMGKGGMPGSMGGMNMPSPNAMPGMAGPSSSMMMDDMMMMMDNMMMMMEKMMGMPDM